MSIKKRHSFQLVTNRYLTTSLTCHYFFSMSTIFDYIIWRGDLSFEASPFNEIDALIFCEFAYLRLNGIVPEEFSQEGVTIAQAAETFFADSDVAARIDTGLFFSESVARMLKALATTERYGQLRLSGFVEEHDAASEKQFAAITIALGDGSFFVAFRGTDNTLVGWKEDFNMVFMTPVPAQQSALEYLCRAATRLPGKIRVGGHSKGGNLAVYAATFCGKRVQRRIGDVYNNDGPGFELSITQAQEFQEISECVHTFVPNQSIVGMLLEHEEDYVVVESHETGLLQHDPFSWQLDGPHFQVVEQVSGGSKMLDRSVKSWLRDLSSQERERVVDGLFEILSSSQASTISELVDTWKKNPGKAVSAFLLVNAETRRLVWRAFQQLFRATHQEIKLDIKLWLQEKLQDAETTQVIVPE